MTSTAARRKVECSSHCNQWWMVKIWSQSVVRLVRQHFMTIRSQVPCWGKGSTTIIVWGSFRILRNSLFPLERVTVLVSWEQQGTRCHFVWRYWRPAPAVIPALIVYSKIVVVKTLVFYSLVYEWLVQHVLTSRLSFIKAWFAGYCLDLSGIEDGSSAFTHEYYGLCSWLLVLSGAFTFNTLDF